MNGLVTNSNRVKVITTEGILFNELLYSQTLERQNYPSEKRRKNL